MTSLEEIDEVEADKKSQKVDSRDDVRDAEQLLHTTDAALSHNWICGGKTLNRLDQIQQTVHSIIVKFLQSSTQTTAATKHFESQSLYPITVLNAINLS